MNLILKQQTVITLDTDLYAQYAISPETQAVTVENCLAFDEGLHRFYSSKLCENLHPYQVLFPPVIQNQNFHFEISKGLNADAFEIYVSCSGEWYPPSQKLQNIKELGALGQLGCQKL